MKMLGMTWLSLSSLTAVAQTSPATPESIAIKQ